MNSRNDLEKIGNNIMNAFNVVDKTYENIYKFFPVLDSIASENDYISITPKYLRWLSYSTPIGIAIKSFIKLYQYNNDEDHKIIKDMKIGPIYSVEINLYISYYKVPKIIIAKSLFNNIDKRQNNFNTDNAWIFHDPIKIKDKFTNQKLKNNYFVCEPKNEKIKKKYEGLDIIYYTIIDLLNVKNEKEIKENIIDNFFKLKELE